jgi:hypothetical protein
MSGFIATYFGPLDKSACVYFLIITVIFFIALVALIINEIRYLVMNFKKVNLRMISAGVLILFNMFLAYFVNRLLYTMCTKSLA